MEKQLIKYTCTGNGPPVILLHGLSASRCDWIWLSSDLEDAGFRVYSPDLLGHGESAKPEDPALYTTSVLYAVIADWLECLPETDPFFIVGHSLGGHLAMLLALRRPHLVRRMVLLDPFYSKRQLSAWIRLVFRQPRLAEEAVRYSPAWLINSIIGLDPWTTNNFPPDVRRQIAGDYKRSAAQVMHYPATAQDLTSHLAQINHSSLVIWGERDLTLAPDSFPSLVRQLPLAAGRSVANCGHQPHVSRPELINPWIVDFFLDSIKTNDG